MKRRELFRTAGVAGVAGTLGKLGLPALTPDHRPVGHPLRRAGASDLEARLVAALAKYKVPGASVAIFHDGTLETAAAGVANQTSGVTVTAETVMHIGSITKTLNATLVMQLVDEGKVTLEAPLKRYLPEFRLADSRDAGRITVGMLLNHTSGIDGELFPDAGHDHERIVDAIPRIARQGQIHAPGAELSYCNSAVVLAGHMAERLTGKSWYDLVKERIFQPLEMRHAVILPEDALLHRASVGHFLDPANGAPIRTSFAFLPLSFAPAGATAMMSAADLVTFARAHLDGGVGPNGHRLLSTASAERMQRVTARWRGIGFADFGLGWMTLPNSVIAHTGGGPGIVAGLYAHPSSRTAVAVLTNAGHGTSVINEIAAPLLAGIGAEPLGSDATRLLKDATDAPVDPKPYLGRYESLATANRIVEHGNGIALRTRSKFKIYDQTSVEESPPVPLRPIREGHFAVGASVLTFLEPGPDGRMKYLALGGRLVPRVG